MPKLLSLNSYHYRRGGSDVCFLDHHNLFGKQNWQTAVMTMHHPLNEASPWSRFFADEIEFGHEYGFMEKLSMAGKVIYSYEAKRKLAALLDEFSADIAHAHCIYHHLSPSVFVELKQRGIPTVMTTHDLKLACPAYKMLNRTGICEKCKGGNLLHLVANRCIRDSLAVSGLIALESAIHKSLGLYRQNLDRVVTPSLFFLEKLVEWGWPREQLIHIPNFLDAENFQPNYEPGDYFFYFGRLSFEKGVATLIQAAAKAKVKLRIAGTGPEREVLQSMSEKLGADVEFLGFVSGEPLWNWVRGARAIVLPSEWYENGPMSVLEAYACGKPAIGARIGGIPEMIKEGETGALFESGDILNLVDVLRNFADMPDQKISQLGLAAREYVLQDYTSKRYLSEMMDLYSELLTP